MDKRLKSIEQKYCKLLLAAFIAWIVTFSVVKSLIGVTMFEAAMSGVIVVMIVAILYLSERSKTLEIVLKGMTGIMKNVGVRVDDVIFRGDYDRVSLSLKRRNALVKLLTSTLKKRKPRKKSVEGAVQTGDILVYGYKMPEGFICVTEARILRAFNNLSTTQ